MIRLEYVRVWVFNMSSHLKPKHRRVLRIQQKQHKQPHRKKETINIGRSRLCGSFEKIRKIIASTSTAAAAAAAAAAAKL